MTVGGKPIDFADLAGAKFVKVPTIEEADAIAPVRAAIEAIADRLRKHVEERCDGQPMHIRRMIYDEANREFQVEVQPLADALSSRLALVPLQWLAIKE